ncbi:MAG: hypothetical protein HDS04_00980 [Bacteroides sp.]|nr:hypothetical protein [Bacteroides sp.]
MIDLLYYLGAGLLGTAAGYFIGKAIAKYVEAALDWFKSVKSQISRVLRAAGILYRKGTRMFKALIVQLTNGEDEQYIDTEDEGVEINKDELSEEAYKALYEDDYIVVETYE